MGLPVTVYRSTDQGAPVGTAANPLDWITILKNVWSRAMVINRRLVGR
ncbi:hypothetical protein N7V09_12505 [Shewanella seohaensis]|nr:hypothetical protein [Shewanella seohaensis]UXM80718.1 hypothetical protein N7V09_12505 [Shewanella seohaensis]